MMKVKNATNQRNYKVETIIDIVNSSETIRRTTTNLAFHHYY